MANSVFEIHYTIPATRETPRYDNVARVVATNYHSAEKALRNKVSKSLIVNRSISNLIDVMVLEI